MVHLKVILDTRRIKSDGTFPIVYRIINVKDVYRMPAGISVKEEQWDITKSQLKTTHPNYSTLSLAINKRFYEIQKAIMQLDDNRDFSYDALKVKLSITPVKIVPILTFESYANTIVEEFLAVKRTGNALVYKTAINRVVAYADNPVLQLKDIDFSFLDGFQNKLLREGMRKNTIGNYLRSIRAIFNKAIKAKVISRDLYPFSDIPIKTEKTAKRAITISELVKVYQFPKRPNSPEWHAANYFFLSFALRGISFTDMAYLTKANIYKGYVTYKRRKTGKLYKIRLAPMALKILAYYEQSDSKYLIPIFSNDTTEDSIAATKITRQWIKTTNKYLKRIAVMCQVEIEITTYVSRHTWATIARRIGFAIELISQALGHDYGNKMTNIYLEDFDQVVIDKMNNKVLFTLEPCVTEIKYVSRYWMNYAVSNSALKQNISMLKFSSRDNPFSLLSC
ncbi:MAG: hypothetical protein EOO43_02440 [Flavobacterium sp.]|nr:MAG: hypothetical protein EOO43_02440 [Flavobacterium sp.]